MILSIQLSIDRFSLGKKWDLEHLKKKSRILSLKTGQKKYSGFLLLFIHIFKSKKKAFNGDRYQHKKGF